MPIFEEDFRVLSQELKTSPDEGLPPFISFLITSSSLFISLVISLVFIFPTVRAYFQLPYSWGLFITLGVFMLIHFVLAEILTRLTDQLRRNFA